jgi:Peptidase family U32
VAAPVRARGRDVSGEGSAGRFPDGAADRIEIPSTESPAALAAIVEEAERWDVPVHRVSQGSGVSMLTDDELDRFATLGAEAGVEVSLFARPGAAWGASAAARAPAGGAYAPAAWGTEQVRAALDDAVRAAEHGIRSVLIADLGVLAAFGRMRAAGDLPPQMQAKASVMLPTTNPETARVLQDLGADTINVAGDLPVEQIAAIRDAVTVPIDLYVESPDDLGGFVRMHEIDALIRAAAPMYVKLGLRNAPPLYPYGAHLEATALAMSRERVRRARLVVEHLERAGDPPPASRRGAAGLAMPVRAGRPNA